MIDAIDPVTNDVLLQEIQEQQADATSRALVSAASLVAFATTATDKLDALGATASVAAIPAASSDPWSGFNWPVAPTGGSSNVNPNASNFPINPYSGGSDDGYLQQLDQIFQELQQNPTDLNLLPTLIELLGNCANNPTIANDPRFQAILQKFPVGADGRSALAGIAQVIVLMEFNSTGGDTSKVSAFITQLLGMPGMNSPLLSDFSNELLYQQQNLGVLTQDFMPNGQLGYTDNDPLFGANGIFISCTQNQFYTYIGGLLGTDVVAPSSSIFSGSTFSSAIQGIIQAQIDTLLDQLKNAKDPGEALILLMMLIGTTKDGMYQNQLTGFAGTTQWLSDHTSQVTSLINSLNATQFSGAAGPQNAQNFIGSLIQIYEDTKGNPNASGLTSSIQTALSSILNLSGGSAGSTILSDYQQGLQTGDFSALANQLNADCQNVASGDGLTILNGIKQMSQIFTNESQAIGTKIQAISAYDQQITNFLQSFLTNSSTGVTAAMNAIITNSKTS